LAVVLLVVAAISVVAPEWLMSVTPGCLISRMIGDGACWGCGITRAVVHLVHFRYSAAMAANPLVLVVAPGLAWIVFKFVLRSYRAEQGKRG